MMKALFDIDRTEFVKVITDDADAPAWEWGHFLREWVCLCKRDEQRTPWAHWVMEGIEATSGKRPDAVRLRKAIRELTNLAQK